MVTIMCVCTAPYLYLLFVFSEVYDKEAIDVCDIFQLPLSQAKTELIRA